MMTMLRSMITCRWAAHRIQRYLDGDPAAPLTATEVARLEAHLAVCARCSGRTEEYRALGRALQEWSTRHAPDAELIGRARDTARRLVAQEPG